MAVLPTAVHDPADYRAWLDAFQERFYEKWEDQPDLTEDGRLLSYQLNTIRTALDQQSLCLARIAEAQESIARTTRLLYEKPEGDGPDWLDRLMAPWRRFKLERWHRRKAQRERAASQSVSA